MEGARYPPFALQFTDVADIDQHGVLAARELNGLIDRQCLYLALGSFAQGLVSGRDRLWHGASYFLNSAVSEHRIPVINVECMDSGLRVSRFRNDEVIYMFADGLLPLKSLSYPGWFLGRPTS